MHHGLDDNVRFLLIAASNIKTESEFTALMVSIEEAVKPTDAFLTHMQECLVEIGEENSVLFKIVQTIIDRRKKGMATITYTENCHKEEAATSDGKPIKKFVDDWFLQRLQGPTPGDEAFFKRWTSGDTEEPTLNQDRIEAGSQAPQTPTNEEGTDAV